MPPFRMPERPATLVFSEGPLAGLELEVRLAVPFDFYFEMTSLMDAPNDDEALASMRTLLSRFAEVGLSSWNLTDDAGPVPCTPEAFMAHVDPLSGGLMLRRYMAAIGQLSPPLAAPSANGRTSKARRVSKSRRSS